MMNAESDDQPSPVLVAATSSAGSSGSGGGNGSGAENSLLLQPNMSNNLVNISFNSLSLSQPASKSPTPEQIGAGAAAGSSNQGTPSPSASLMAAFQKPGGGGGASPAPASSFFDQLNQKPALANLPPSLGSTPPPSAFNKPVSSLLNQSPLVPPPMPFGGQQPNTTTTDATGNNQIRNSVTPPAALQKPLEGLPSMLLQQPPSLPPMLLQQPPLPQQPPMPSSSSSIAAPSLSMPPLQATIPPPPISIPPPPPSIGGGTSSGGAANPYAAKGALNKKVYDLGVTVAPAVGTIPAFSAAPPPLGSDPSGGGQAAANTMFVPPPPPTTLSSSIQPPMPPPISSLTQTSMLPPPAFSQPLGPPQFPLISSDNLMMGQDPNRMSQPFMNDNSSALNFGGGGNGSAVQDNNNSSYGNRQNKMWNWFGNVVEKAKQGVESIVTVVDPQMKEFIHPANRQLYLVSTVANNKLVHLIREAFVDAGFSKISQNAFDVQPSAQFAPQVVGFPCAIQLAKQKLDMSYQMLNSADCLVFSFQDFVVELSPESWFEMAVVMLKDRTSNIELSLFTEATPVSLAEIGEAQQNTPADYPLRWSGFATKLRSHYHNLSSTLISNQTNPYASSGDGLDSQISVARMSHALKTLALLYKARIIETLR